VPSRCRDGGRRRRVDLSGLRPRRRRADRFGRPAQLRLRRAGLPDRFCRRRAPRRTRPDARGGNGADATRLRTRPGTHRSTLRIGQPAGAALCELPGHRQEGVLRSAQRNRHGALCDLVVLARLRDD
jgi:hypothetical protein